MAIERERKFLLKDSTWKDVAGGGVSYVQGYIHSSENKTIRVRIAGDNAFLTIKGAIFKDDPAARNEYEYNIPVNDAKEMLESLCTEGQIEKVRYKIPYKGNLWEVDEFLGANQGLVVAEVEFNEKNQDIALPTWIGKEVTEDKRYTNASLARDSYSNFL